MIFKDFIATMDWDEVSQSIYTKTSDDVLKALSKPKKDLEDFKALISPAAEPYLEPMAQLSQQLTQKRFGKTIQMYIPLYLSNECQNICTYCGFSLEVKIPRKTLSEREILNEVKVIKNMGYDHILLVTGESNKTVGVTYLKNVIKLIRPYFSNISMEIQPLEQQDYEALISEGLNAVLVYQETYHRENYKKYHPKGKKSNYNFRINTPDRLGASGIHKIGLGILIGLEDWRVDSFFTALHLRYLEQKYWKTRYSISFPRLRPCESNLEMVSAITDAQLVQLICAYRILNQEVELSISTRESEKFRSHIINLGITSTSADSKTNPGGYSSSDKTLEQFIIDDRRSTNEVMDSIRKNGYEPIFKDWDRTLNSNYTVGSHDESSKF